MVCIKTNFSKTNILEMFCSFDGTLVFKFICIPKCAYQWWIDTSLTVWAPAGKQCRLYSQQVSVVIFSEKKSLRQLIHYILA